MSKYYLAIDIGASSGRHMLGHLEDGKIILEEIHRFKNGVSDTNGSLCWDIQTLLKEIIVGIKKCGDLNKIPESVGIDTWGVDFILIDEDGNDIGQPVSYRDDRTVGMDSVVEEYISASNLYKRTGIQKQDFNTIYQLTALKQQDISQLQKSEALLMIPDYLHYKLTDIKTNEYTNATTTGLINLDTKEWDYELLEQIGIPSDMLGKIEQPGTIIGTFTKEIEEAVGFNAKVIIPPTHDTASAVAAAPLRNEESLYISSGTWSLIGTENKEPICCEASRQANFTNEGGYANTYRYLKNIMGLWMVQCVYFEYEEKYSYAKLCELASQESITTIVDCNDKSFFAPKSMVESIQAYATKTNQQVPQTVGEIAAVIYNSLAHCYKQAIEEIEELTGKSYETINIIGGGANADYLNRITAKVTQKAVIAGPTEATAIGNLITQMITEQEFENLAQARGCIANSFDLIKY